MKKYLILIFSILLLTGCYDNIELNNISIISGIGIDYIDNNYIVTYEIYNDNKSQNTADLLSYTVTGKGNTVNNAFIDANYKTGKKPFFAHLKVVLISENIKDEILKNITDYLFRNTEIRDEFKLLITNNCLPEDILKMSNKYHPVISNHIDSLIEQEKYNNESSTRETFKTIISKLLSKDTDIILNSITIINDEISLSDSFIFNKYSKKYNISNKDTALYNLLTRKVINASFNKYYENDVFSISIIDSKNKIDIKADTIIIDLDLKGQVTHNGPDFDLRKSSTYKLLNKDMCKVIKNDIKKFVTKLQDNNTDIIGFNNIYYKKYNNNNYNTWKYYDLKINCNLNIIKQGYIFGGNNE